MMYSERQREYYINMFNNVNGDDWEIGITSVETRISRILSNEAMKYSPENIEENDTVTETNTNEGPPKK